ncbi:hypothetical protein LXL04_038985 [Taraxacum kok-saghyz]
MIREVSQVPAFQVSGTAGINVKGPGNLGRITGESGAIRCGFKVKPKAVLRIAVFENVKPHIGVSLRYDFAKTLPMFKLPIFSLNSSISLFFIAQPSSRSTGELLIQSCAQIKASAVSGLRELIYLSITLPPVLNADSDATVEIGIAKTCDADSQELAANSPKEAPNSPLRRDGFASASMAATVATPFKTEAAFSHVGVKA